ncbi:MAG: hypothetical protein M3R38_04700 [Actinomycetota bacterium]|nr:hypothetical protein [Actinomycetota bacterium]
MLLSRMALLVVGAVLAAALAAPALGQAAREPVETTAGGTAYVRRPVGGTGPREAHQHSHGRPWTLGH